MMDMLLDHIKDAHGYIRHAIEAKTKGMKDVCVWNLEHAEARIEMFESDSADLLRFKQNHGMSEDALDCLSVCLNAHSDMAQHMLEWAKDCCNHTE